MSALRISAYVQRHPKDGSRKIAKALGMSTATVYKYRTMLYPEYLPSYEVSDLALRIWLTLDETSVRKHILADLGISPASFYRGMKELKEAGLAYTFESPKNGKIFYRRRESPMLNPFDPFDDTPMPPKSQEPVAPAEAVFEQTPTRTKTKTTSRPTLSETLDEIDKPTPRTPRETVATTADTFAAWVKDRFPGIPGQVNRRALMGYLGKARKEHGIKHHQETGALESFLWSNPNPLPNAPLWKQFLAKYPTLVMKEPETPVDHLARNQAYFAERAGEREAFAKARAERKAKEAFRAQMHQETIAMAQELDTQFRDALPFPRAYWEYGNASYVKKVEELGKPLADPWDPNGSAAANNLWGIYIGGYDPLSGQTQEGRAQPTEQEYNEAFEKRRWAFLSPEAKERERRKAVEREDRRRAAEIMARVHAQQTGQEPGTTGHDEDIHTPESATGMPLTLAQNLEKIRQVTQEVEQTGVLPAWIKTEPVHPPEWMREEQPSEAPKRSPKPAPQVHDTPSPERLSRMQEMALLDAQSDRDMDAELMRSNQAAMEIMAKVLQDLDAEHETFASAP